MRNSIFTAKIKKYKEIINQKVVNENYYLKAFERLEKENKHTWNWAAFLFPREWMIYRKMYLFSAIFTSIYLFLLYGLYPMIKRVIQDEVLSESLILFAFVVVNIFSGYLGNELYYLTVKHRISNGYHLLKKYVCASGLFLVCVLSLLVMATDLIIYMFAMPILWDTDVRAFLRFFICLFVLLFACVGDYLQNRRELSKSSLSKNNTKISNENISLYLKQRKQHNIFEKILVIGACWTFLVYSLNRQSIVEQRKQAQTQEINLKNS